MRTDLVTRISPVPVLTPINTPNQHLHVQPVVPARTPARTHTRSSSREADGGGREVGRDVVNGRVGRLEQLRVHLWDAPGTPSSRLKGRAGSSPPTQCKIFQSPRVTMRHVPGLLVTPRPASSRCRWRNHPTPPQTQHNNQTFSVPNIGTLSVGDAGEVANVAMLPVD
jgi:hypothetical protein